MQEGKLAALLLEELVKLVTEVLIKGSPASRGKDHVLFDFERGKLPTGTGQGLKRRRDVMAPLCLPCDGPAQQALRSHRTWDPVSKETPHQERKPR